jgi:hypothetical protein
MAQPDPAMMRGRQDGSQGRGTVIAQSRMERRAAYRALVVEDDGAILNLVKIALDR